MAQSNSSRLGQRQVHPFLAHFGLHGADQPLIRHAFADRTRHDAVVVRFEGNGDLMATAWSLGEIMGRSGEIWGDRAKKPS